MLLTGDRGLLIPLLTALYTKTSIKRPKRGPDAPEKTCLACVELRWLETDQTDHDLDHLLPHLLAVVRGCAGSDLCIFHIQPRKQP